MYYRDEVQGSGAQGKVKPPFINLNLECDVGGIFELIAYLLLESYCMEKSFQHLISIITGLKTTQRELENKMYKEKV